jgi:hypothetical protein
MEYENLSLARDLMYLFALLAGAGAGSLLSIFKRKNTLRKRASWVSAALFFFSGAIASAALAVIFSKGAVFTLFPLYVPALAVLAAGVLAVRFPRAGAGAVMLAAGLCAAWMWFTFSTAPRLEGEAAKRARQLSVQSQGDGKLIISRREKSETWNIKDDGNPLEFKALAFTPAFPFPLIGGERRGLITGISRGADTIYSSGREPTRFFPSGGIERFSLALPAKAVPPGMGLLVLFDGKELRFDPPIQAEF